MGVVCSRPGAVDVLFPEVSVAEQLSRSCNPSHPNPKDVKQSGSSRGQKTNSSKQCPSSAQSPSPSAAHPALLHTDSTDTTPCSCDHAKGDSKPDLTTALEAVSRDQSHVHRKVEDQPLSCVEGQCLTRHQRCITWDSSTIASSEGCSSSTALHIEDQVIKSNTAESMIPVHRGTGNGEHLSEALHANTTKSAHPSPECGRISQPGNECCGDHSCPSLGVAPAFTDGDSAHHDGASRASSSIAGQMEDLQHSAPERSAHSSPLPVLHKEEVAILTASLRRHSQCSSHQSPSEQHDSEAALNMIQQLHRSHSKQEAAEADDHASSHQQTHLSHDLDQNNAQPQARQKKGIKKRRSAGAALTGSKSSQQHSRLSRLSHDSRFGMAEGGISQKLSGLHLCIHPKPYPAVSQPMSAPAFYLSPDTASSNSGTSNPSSGSPQVHSEPTNALQEAEPEPLPLTPIRLVSKAAYTDGRAQADTAICAGPSMDQIHAAAAVAAAAVVRNAAAWRSDTGEGVLPEVGSMDLSELSASLPPSNFGSFQASSAAEPAGRQWGSRHPSAVVSSHPAREVDLADMQDLLPGSKLAGAATGTASSHKTLAFASANSASQRSAASQAARNSVAGNSLHVFSEEEEDFCDGSSYAATEDTEARFDRIQARLARTKSGQSHSYNPYNTDTSEDSDCVSIGSPDSMAHFEALLPPSRLSLQVVFPSCRSSSGAAASTTTSLEVAVKTAADAAHRPGSRSAIAQAADIAAMEAEVFNPTTLNSDMSVVELDSCNTLLELDATLPKAIAATVLDPSGTADTRSTTSPRPTFSFAELHSCSTLPDFATLVPSAAPISILASTGATEAKSSQLQPAGDDPQCIEDQLPDDVLIASITKGPGATHRMKDGAVVKSRISGGQGLSSLPCSSRCTSEAGVPSAAAVVDVVRCGAAHIKASALGDMTVDMEQYFELDPMALGQSDLQLPSSCMAAVEM